jgi:hypothetical protein
VRRIRPSTPEERAVIVWVAVILLALMGGVALYYSFHAALLDRPETARQLGLLARASFMLSGVLALMRVVLVRLLA